MDGSAAYMPAWLRDDGLGLHSDQHGRRPNLSETAQRYLERLGADVEDLFHHVIAVLHDPTYREANAGALRMEWPRIPLPGWPDGDEDGAADELAASAARGRELAALLDSDTPVPGVTEPLPGAPAGSALRPEIAAVAVPSITGGGNMTGEDFALTVGWGHFGQGEAVMPGQGRVIERPYTASERAALGRAAPTLGDTASTPNNRGETGGMSNTPAPPVPASHVDAATGKTAAILGDTTFDIYLNDRAYWRNVPAAVWTYKLGGYQVLKKWLSYRESTVLGRPLQPEEVQHFTNTARRITAILLAGDRQLRCFYSVQDFWDAKDLEGEMAYIRQGSFQGKVLKGLVEDQRLREFRREDLERGIRPDTLIVVNVMNLDRDSNWKRLQSPPPRTGRFSAFMDEVEEVATKAGCRYVQVESVFNEFLPEKLEERGYRMLSSSGSSPNPDYVKVLLRES